jgi:hypothetical protein
VASDNRDGDLPHRPRPPVPSSTYAALGVLGLVLFFAGVIIPVLALVPYADYVRIAVAALGGFLAMFGLGRWYHLRHPGGGRSPPRAGSGVESMPSLEYFSPARSSARQIGRAHV